MSVAVYTFNLTTRPLFFPSLSLCLVARLALCSRTRFSTYQIHLILHVSNFAVKSYIFILLYYCDDDDDGATGCIVRCHCGHLDRIFLCTHSGASECRRVQTIV